MIEALALNISGYGTIITLCVFLLTFTFITTEKLPNAVAASVGAFLLVAFHIVSQE